jgi:hypothetical protein
MNTIHDYTEQDIQLAELYMEEGKTEETVRLMFRLAGMLEQVAYNTVWHASDRVTRRKARTRRIGEAHKACVACNEVHEGVPLGRHCLSY